MTELNCSFTFEHIYFLQLGVSKKLEYEKFELIRISHLLAFELSLLAHWLIKLIDNSLDLMSIMIWPSLSLSGTKWLESATCTTLCVNPDEKIDYEEASLWLSIQSYPDFKRPCSTKLRYEPCLFLLTYSKWVP